MSIKLVNAALEEKDGNEIVLRGLLDPASLRELKSGPYQREVLPVKVLNALTDAVAIGRTPDVILGMRGQRYTTRSEDFFLLDDVYIIDGLQRIEAGKRMMALGAQKPHLGALIYFNSNEGFEREQFLALNTQAVKLSPNIIVRNLRQSNEAVATLYSVSQDKAFPLAGRVTWQQRASSGHLISATTMLKATARLHSFVDTASGLRSQRVTDLAENLNEIVNIVGKAVFRSNVHTFYDTIDAAWGIRSVTYKDGATQLRYTFTNVLADVLAMHWDFWGGHDKQRLIVARELIHKLSKFPMSDPTIKSMANSGGGHAANHLRQLIIDHLDKGKRSGHLRPRKSASEIGKKAAPLPLPAKEPESAKKTPELVT